MIEIQKAGLCDIINGWVMSHFTMSEYDIKAIQLCDAIEAFIDREITKKATEITNEEAIAQLQKSGWMQKHDAIIGMDSLSSVVNRIMQDGNKTITVNIYPWKEDECGDD